MSNEQGNEKQAKNEGIKIQYDKLDEDWRQFNTILWGIPAVAISIMAGIIVVVYNQELEGWP